MMPTTTTTTTKTTTTTTTTTATTTTSPEATVDTPTIILPWINELSTAASYLILFASFSTNAKPPIATARRSNHHQEASTTTITTTPCSSSSSILKEDISQPPCFSPSLPPKLFWKEDNWTEEDLKKAQECLLSTMEDHDEDDDSDEDNHSQTPFSEEYVQRQRQRLRSTIYESDDNNHTSHNNAWNAFYQRHLVGFFRDRHYLAKEFPNEFPTTKTTTKTAASITPAKTWIEMGCGVGNAILPFLEQSDDNDDNDDNDNNNTNDHDAHFHGGSRAAVVQGWTIHALDLSPVAIALLQQDERWTKTLARYQQYESSSASLITPPRLFAHVCDVTCQPLPNSLTTANNNNNDGVADIMTLLFCLSAISPERMPYAIRNMTQGVKVGGVILLRDYGRYDQAQLQLAKQQQNQNQQPPKKSSSSSKPAILDSISYVKQDGTCCYYFTMEEIQYLMEHYGGCETLQLQYLQRIYINRATQQPRRRVWVQGRFLKRRRQVPMEEVTL